MLAPCRISIGLAQRWLLKKFTTTKLGDGTRRLEAMEPESSLFEISNTSRFGRRGHGIELSNNKRNPEVFEIQQ